MLLRDELHRFLDTMHFVMPNLNDTFGYASADSEKIYMDDDCREDPEEGPSNQDMLVEMYCEYGIDGIRAYVSKIRNADVIAPLRTIEYEQAKQALAGWEYDPD